VELERILQLHFENIGKKMVKKSIKFLFRVIDTKNNWTPYLKKLFNLEIGGR